MRGPGPGSPLPRTPATRWRARTSRDGRRGPLRGRRDARGTGARLWTSVQRGPQGKRRDDLSLGLKDLPRARLDDVDGEVRFRQPDEQVRVALLATSEVVVEIVQIDRKTLDRSARGVSVAH